MYLLCTRLSSNPLNRKVSASVVPLVLRTYPSPHDDSSITLPSRSYSWLMLMLTAVPRIYLRVEQLI